MYVKMFSKMLKSSIWLEDNATRIVWVTLLLSMDEDGFCQFASTRNLAREANVTPEESQKAINIFESPDAESSDPDNGGVRIERVPGGWMVLNSAKYRDQITRNDGKVKTRERVARFRQKKRDTDQSLFHAESCNADVTVRNDHVTLSEAYTDSEVEEPIPPPLFSDVCELPKPILVRHSKPKVFKSPETAKQAYVVDRISDAYKAANDGTTPPLSNLFFGRLKKELDGNPRWMEADWEKCIRHRFASIGRVNIGESPEQFVGKLKNFIAGPLNEFGATGGSNGTHRGKESNYEKQRRYLKESIIEDLGYDPEGPTFGDGDSPGNDDGERFAGVVLEGHRR